MTSQTLMLLLVTLSASVPGIYSQTKCLGKLDIIFAVDGSNSMGEDNFILQRTSLSNLVEKLAISPDEILVGLVPFSSSVDPSEVIQLTGDKAALKQRINTLYYPDEQTRTDLAIDEAINMFRRFGRGGSVPKLLMVITDGASTAPIKTSTSSNLAKNNNITIYALGVTRQVDVDELQRLASKPDKVLLTPDFTTLENSLINATNKACVDLTPPPVPGCYMGYSDLWLVLDVSSTAETLTRVDYTGDFAKLKNGVGKLMEIVVDPSVQNKDIQTGLITYSSNARVVVDLNSPNSVVNTVNNVKSIPNGVFQSGASLVSALRLITNPARDMNYRSYVAIVAPESTYQAESFNIQTEFARLKTLGFTIVPIVIYNNNRQLDVNNLQNQASGSLYFYGINTFNDLEAATKNFTRDRLCNGYVPPRVLPSGGLCDSSAHRQNGMDVVPHPSDCDKYVQCYYNNVTGLDIGVVRNCPMGLYWNQPTKNCANTTLVNCPNDKCREDCDPYKMEGACGAYWDCENGVSVPKCCPANFAFVDGVGCQLDFNCKDQCQAEKWCGLCQKKPNWLVASGYDVQLANGALGWLPRPCFYEDFDVVDCDCTAPRNEVCPADREYFFNDTATVISVLDSSRDGIRVTSVTNSGMALALNTKSIVHVDVNKVNEHDSYVIEFVYRENSPLSPYGETLFSSGVSCKHVNTLMITANDQFVFAELRSAEGRQAEVKVPTTGLSVNEFKLLTLEFNKGIMSLSVKGSKQQYIAQTTAPALACLSCGIDIGAGVHKNGFRGEVQKIAIRSCSLPKLY